MSPISEAARADAAVIWDYHQLHHELRACDVAIGLGTHDIGVAEYTAKLYHAGYAPTVLFTGATSPTTRDVFPAGEAIAYRDRAVELGVPAGDILVEPNATNTGQNITMSHALLQRTGIHAASVLLVSTPYMQRRAYATCARRWPEITAICASEPITMPDYIARNGDEQTIIDILVGDLQRIMIYPHRGFAAPQRVPAAVRAAFSRLMTAGFTSRLVPG